MCVGGCLAKPVRVCVCVCVCVSVCGCLAKPVQERKRATLDSSVETEE